MGFSVSLLLLGCAPTLPDLIQARHYHEAICLAVDNGSHRRIVRAGGCMAAAHHHKGRQPHQARGVFVQLRQFFFGRSLAHRVVEGA